jgi:hypothetical protein
MAALSHDFKAQRRASADRTRLRDFGYGAACGALLSGIVFAWLGARAHPNPVQPAPAAQHPQPVAKSEPDAAAGTLTFPEILAKSTVPVFPTDGSARHAPPPAAHPGPTR